MSELTEILSIVSRVFEISSVLMGKEGLISISNPF